MAFKVSQVAVGTTATPLVVTAVTSSGPKALEILNPTGSGGSIFLGGDTTVTSTGTTKGREIQAGASAYAIDLVPGDLLYAVAASGTVTVTVTQAGV